MANIVRFDPFAELATLQKQFFGDDWFASGAGSLRVPTTDVYMDGDKQMVVEAHLPYFEEKDIQVNIDNGTLEIQAEKHEKQEDKDKKYVVRESSSSFYRRVRLPEQADTAKVDARMDDGVLKIIVPFKKLPAPKRVTISSSGASSKKKK